MVLTQSGGLLSLTISDRGTGFNSTQEKPGGGLGLVGIKERARLVNGTVELTSAEGQGTTVTVAIPVPLMSEASGPRINAPQRG
jgi:signal transduction histidine kinase